MTGEMAGDVCLDFGTDPFPPAFGKSTRVSNNHSVLPLIIAVRKCIYLLHGTPHLYGCTMPAFKIVVFAGDHCGPEVSRVGAQKQNNAEIPFQVTAEAIKVDPNTLTVDGSSRLRLNTDIEGD